RAAAGAGEPQHQSDAEPDSADLGADVPYRSFAVGFRRPGAQRFFICLSRGNSDRYLFVDCGGFSHACGMAGVASRQGENSRPARGKAGALNCRAGNISAAGAQNGNIWARINMLSREEAGHDTNGRLGKLEVLMELRSTPTLSDCTAFRAPFASH